jgi:hypothetical protein
MSGTRDALGWTEVPSPEGSELFRRIMPLSGYPATLPESFLTGNQGTGFICTADGIERAAAILMLDFLFVCSLEDHEEFLGAAAGQLVRELLGSGRINAVHLLPPLCAGNVLTPGSAPFFRAFNGPDLSWGEYVRMEFIGNAADHRSDELVSQGFPFADAEVELPGDSVVSIRSFCGRGLPADPTSERRDRPRKRDCKKAMDLEIVAAEAWSRDLVMAMGGIEAFRRDGMGVFLYDGDELICGASSFCRYPNAVEVEVDTRPERRNAGLARWAGAALSVLAAVHDQYLCWDAAHPSSARIAIDLGLGFSGHYICSVYRFADESRKTPGGIEH